jgi:GTP-binding protein EngB required for normal cell division
MAEQPPQRLRQLIALAEAAEAPSLVQEASALAERIQEGRFYVACVGQFKRGKSTLLNALVGEPVLPVGVVPVTAAVTILRKGEERGAQVRFADGRTQAVPIPGLAAYVAEDQNPGNVKGVRAVEVFLPSPLLSHGMSLVDTPGLGSVFSGNTAVTREFIPHIDAALVVLGADPPISGEELELVETVSRQVSQLVFVLNKADRLNDTERGEASRFAERILSQRLGRPVGPLFQVSATERLAGTPSRDWEPLQRRLEALARESGAELVSAALERGINRLVRQLLRDLEERRDALIRPLDESQHRLGTLRQGVADAERSLRELGYLFQAEQDQLSRQFGAKREEFLAQVLPAAARELEDALQALHERSGRKLRVKATELAQQIARRHLESWRSGIEPVAAQMYREASMRLASRANDFLGQWVASGIPGMDALPQALEPETGFRMRSHLYYTELMRLTGTGPLGFVLDTLRPPDRAHRAVLRDVGAYLERLLTTNSSRIAGDLDERVMESRRSMEGEIRSRLRQLVTTGEHALERARKQHALGARAVEEELHRLERLLQEIRSL